MKSKGIKSAERFLQIVRREMEKQYLGAIIVPTADPHNSEYVPDRFQHRAKLTNFHGSAGTAVVTNNEALLWTDGRYWLEAAASLPEGWELVKSGMPGTLSIEEWLEKKQNADVHKKFEVGVDPNTYDLRSWELLAKKVDLRPTDIIPRAAQELVHEDNSESSELLLKSKVFVRQEDYCGETPTQKLKQIIEKCNSEYPTVDALLFTALDDIAWLTNMRGLNDVPYNPVFISFAVVDIRKKQIHLFADIEQETQTVDSNGNPIQRISVSEHCAAHHIIIHPYSSIKSFITEHYHAQKNGNSGHATKKVIGVEERQTNYALVQHIEGNASHTQESDQSSGSVEGGQAATAMRVSSIVSHLKGTKNPVELKGFEDSHARDGCALVRFMAWISEEMKNGSASIRETDCSDKVDYFRRQEDLHRGPSFATISSSGPNGAVIHYSPQKGSDRVLAQTELYLIDSGGQYEDGTTDVTRVLTFDPRLLEKQHSSDSINTNEESEEVQHIRTAYTLVLKGHIALAAVVFPEGVAGYRLDVLARTPLWQHGLEYAHGTGHGVGSFLCVHEGPHSVPSRLPAASVSLKKGMILSNEPGYYEDGHFGIRIENLVSVVEADASKQRYPSGTTLKSKAEDSSASSGTTRSLAFKQLTMVPFNKDLIDVTMLSKDELSFVNAYHAEVRRVLRPLIAKHQDELAIKYLMEYTEPLAA